MQKAIKRSEPSSPILVNEMTMRKRCFGESRYAFIFSIALSTSFILFTFFPFYHYFTFTSQNTIK